MESISKRLREIDKELADLYREKRILEMEQQEHWRKMGWTGPIVAKREDYENFEEIYCPGIARENMLCSYKKAEDVDENGNWAFDNEWSGTLLG
jgi:hypothetical protein